MRILAAALRPAPLLAQPPPGTAATTIASTVLMNGKPAGSEVDTYYRDGRIDSTFEFNDRGRGPKIAAHYKVSPAGLPTETIISGVDYLKSPVDERFTIANGQAHWKSTTEDGHGAPSA